MSDQDDKGPIRVRARAGRTGVGVGGSLARSDQGGGRLSTAALAGQRDAARVRAWHLFWQSDAGARHLIPDGSDEFDAAERLAHAMFWAGCKFERDQRHGQLTDRPVYQETLAEAIGERDQARAELAEAVELLRALLAVKPVPVLAAGVQGLAVTYTERDLARLAKARDLLRRYDLPGQARR